MSLAALSLVLSGSELQSEYANLAAYAARAEARPAFKRAFADQLAVFISKHSN